MSDLWPVIVQDVTSRQVLMLAYTNSEALDFTENTGLAHFYSRSRQKLWKKGESSGHVLPVVRVQHDCDQDAYLYWVKSDNPACHRNTRSCFGDGRELLPDPLVYLNEVVLDRLTGERDVASYTQSLYSGEVPRLIQKVGEEALEVVIAASYLDSREQGKVRVVEEVSDLLYHLTVLLARQNIGLDDVTEELKRRHASSIRLNPA